MRERRKKALKNLSVPERDVLTVLSAVCKVRMSVPCLSHRIFNNAHVMHYTYTIWASTMAYIDMHTCQYAIWALMMASACSQQASLTVNGMWVVRDYMLLLSVSVI